MKLDRYSTGIPKFKVSRLEIDENGNQHYVEVDPWECFVLKRRDCNTHDALVAYAASAKRTGQQETAEEVERLIRDWRSLSGALNDTKEPD